MTRRDHYAQGPGMTLAIGGAAVARAYFRREYGEAGPWAGGGDRPRDLDACFSRLAEGRPGAVIAGRHKLARWRVRVALAPGAAVGLRAQVQGPFGLPLVQSTILEPLLGLAAARRALALVPGALVLDAAGRGVLLVGGSGAGKTSLAARAIAAGREVLADDRVFLDADAGASRFARRMRLYPDIRATAPAAWASLTGGARSRLHAVELLRGATAGRFAPPVAVTRREIGAAAPRAGARVERILLLRREERTQAQLTAVGAAVAVDEIVARIRDDRAALENAGIDDEIRRMELDDRAVLESAAAAATVQRLDIPAAWPAARSVQRRAAELGVP